MLLVAATDKTLAINKGLATAVGCVGQRGGWRHGGLSTGIPGVLWDGAGAAAPPHETLEGTGRDLKGFAGGGGTGEELSVALVWL